MLFDDRDHIWELALRRIIKAREAESSTKRRIFKPPKINFSARDYTEIIVQHEYQVTPSPVVAVKRSDRTTKEQYNILVDFLRENEELIYPGKSHPTQENRVQIKWEIIAKTLNSSETGPLKSVTQWKNETPTGEERHLVAEERDSGAEKTQVDHTATITSNQDITPTSIEFKNIFE
ncbi:hypothetical protein ILUMI_13575 [Ignelater luminosus]|uniref:Regulatory protein zeste n=1 Tax=Ignelater luminosus TaxID=2038154 RepID=A0A8K0CS46_IGNLU|nr:hypothetical protein ILUMI_13575 [Ignelater luminosus]